MAEEQQEQPVMDLKVSLPSNGIHPQMDEEDLLAELSAETVGPSYGYVSLKLTKGEKEQQVKLKVQPIDILRVARDVESMPEKTKKQVLAATKHAQSVGFSDESWLQSLAAFVVGLAPPHVLKDNGEVVWQAGGTPQDLSRAMIAVVKAGFDYWHINRVSNKIAYLTRQVNDEDLLGNS